MEIKVMRSICAITLCQSACGRLGTMHLTFDERRSRNRGVHVSLSDHAFVRCLRSKRP
jgi:hypothetical protein